jgi:acetoin utilization protein AcuC
MTKNACSVYIGDKLGAYGFGDEHPFGPERLQVFSKEFYHRQLDQSVDILPPVSTDRSTLELFHSADYIDRVIELSRTGEGFLDKGDTPAFAGMFEAACYVAGSVVDAAERLMTGEYEKTFVPIAGLHHARRDTAAGFCVVNDCGIAIETLLQRFHLQRVAYVDIDAHHGDGVFYSFEDEPRLIFADIHEDGRFLYPGTGAINETGTGHAAGTKLNIPVPPHSDDEMFFKLWPKVETFIDNYEPEFILLQCGADSIADDPITHLRYSEKSHAHAAKRLSELADIHCEGKLLAMGGGGYNHDNIAKTWTTVVEALAKSV